MEIKEELLDIEGVKASKKPLLELFIRRTAVVTQTSEYLSSLIIKDQWRNMTKESMAGNPTAEFDVPNVGNFCISKPKALKRLESIEFKKQKTMENPVNDDKQLNRKLTALQRYEDMKKYIKIKLKTNEY